MTLSWNELTLAGQKINKTVEYLDRSNESGHIITKINLIEAAKKELAAAKEILKI